MHPSLETLREGLPGSADSQWLRAQMQFVSFQYDLNPEPMPRCHRDQFLTKAEMLHCKMLGFEQSSVLAAAKHFTHRQFVLFTACL